MAEGPTENHSETPNVRDECIDIDELARRFQISRARVFALIKDEGLPSMKLGQKRLFHGPTADAWLKAKLTGVAS